MFALATVQMILIFLSLYTVMFGRPISNHKLGRNAIENDVRYPESPEDAMFRTSRADPFDDMVEEEKDYDLQEDATNSGNALAGDTDIIQIEDGHYNVKSVNSNNTVYRSVPMEGQFADVPYNRPIQMPLAVKMPLAISNLVPMPVPQAVPLMVDHPVPIQRSIPLVIARPVPIPYPVGLVPKVSFPAYNGYGYPYGSGVRFTRSKTISANHTIN